MMILIRVIPLYLEQLIESIKTSVRTEREVVNILGALLEIVSSERSIEILDTMQLNSALFFQGLPSRGFPKIASFKQHQLKRVFK